MSCSCLEFVQRHFKTSKNTRNTEQSQILDDSNVDGENSGAAPTFNTRALFPMNRLYLIAPDQNRS